jgi:hypothetical protein
MIHRQDSIAELDLFTLSDHEESISVDPIKKLGKDVRCFV